MLKKFSKKRNCQNKEILFEKIFENEKKIVGKKLPGEKFLIRKNIFSEKNFLTEKNCWKKFVRKNSLKKQFVREKICGRWIFYQKEKF